MAVHDTPGLPDDPMQMPPPFWRGAGAIFHVKASLADLLRLLEQLVPLNRETDRRLEEYFARKPEVDDDDPEFADICEALWELESQIKLKAEIAILMAAISAEDHLNMFAVFNLHKQVAEPLEKLPPHEKLQVLSALLDKPGITGSHVYGALKKLAAWRNAFAHGHCVDRPTKSLRHNHLTEPAELPGVPSMVADVAQMVSCYVELVDYLCSISKNPYTDGPDWDVDQIRGLLGDIRHYTFSGNNWVYEVEVA